MELPDELVGIEDELDIDEDREPDLPGETTEGEEREDDVEREQFLFVAVGPEEFALHVNAVRRLVDVDHRTRVPRTSAAIDGITDLRGAITAVVDPRVLFDLPEPELPPENEELVVFATGDGEGTAGVVVDEVLGVEAVPATHVVLSADDVGEDADEDVDELGDLLDDPLVAGAIREASGDGHAYSPVVDVDAVLEQASEAAV